MIYIIIRKAYIIMAEIHKVNTMLQQDLIDKDKVIKTHNHNDNIILQRNPDIISRQDCQGICLYYQKKEGYFELDEIKSLIWKCTGYSRTKKQVIKMISLSLRNHNKEKIEENIEEMLDNNLVYMITDYKDIWERMEDVIYHDKRPEIKDDKIRWRREFDDTIFIMIIENGRTILLNNYYGRILELIDGKKKTGEIFKKIRKEFGTIHYQKEHFNDFIEVLLGEEIVQINVKDIDKKPKGLYKNRLGKRIEPSFLMNWHKSAINQRKVEIFLRFSYSPWFVVCETNYECNLRCIGCYAVDYEKTENMICKKQLSTEEFKKHVIDQLALNKVFHITFMGGEPFLREDFWEILEYTVSKGFYIKIQSNGTLITEEKAKQIKGIGVQQVEISLDGIDEPTNDAIRGKGTFKKALNALNILGKIGIPRVGICFTVTKINQHQVPYLIPFARNIGIDEIFFSIYAPMSKNEDLNKKLDLSLNEKRQILDMIHMSQEGNPDMVLFAITNCEAARRVCAISPSGDVRPCTLHKAVAGNLRRETFHHIWSQSEIMRMIRWPSLYKDKCKKCILRFKCEQTYCSAKNFSINNSILNSNCVI